jgi:hypothetical protein
MRMQIAEGISVEPAGGWVDVSDDLAPDAPFTLVLPDGDGAFQISTATYQRGPLPNAGLDELNDMLTSFGKSKGFGAPIEVVSYDQCVCAVGGSFRTEDFVRAWYVTDGRNFVFATHTSATNVPAEIADCEAMIRTIRFSG